MQKTIEKLLTTIDQEIKCYMALDHLLSDEKRAISLSKKDRLDKIQISKEDLVLKLQQHEKKRISLVDRLAGAYGQKELPITVRQLALRINAPEGERLLDKADRLRSIISAVKEKNKKNQLLLHQALDLINGSLSLLTQHMVSNSVYQKAGTFKSFPGYGSGGGRIIRGSV
jgi:flagellar biosynthesis/type III secretory pathway chaperone